MHMEEIKHLLLTDSTTHFQILNDAASWCLPTNIPTTVKLSTTYCYLL